MSPKSDRSAVNSFERVTGKQIQRATLRDLEPWMHTLRENGLSATTCQSYLSAVRRLIAIRDQPTPRKRPTVTFLSEKQIKSILNAAPVADFSWLAVALLAGPEATRWTFCNLYEGERDVPFAAYRVIVAEAERRGMSTFPCPYRGHENAMWIICLRDEPIWNLSQQQIISRLKNMARKAGIGIPMNIAALKTLHGQLLARYETAEKLAGALGLEPRKEQERAARPANRTYIINKLSPTYIERA